MNTRGLLVTIFAVALSFAPQLVSTSSAAGGTYSATLISPRVGQVLYPGQKIRVTWKSTLPNIDLTGCEKEVWLSLAGEHLLCGLALGWTRKPNISIGLFQTRLQTQPSLISALGVKDGIPKALPRSPRRLL